MNFSCSDGFRLKSISVLFFLFLLQAIYSVPPLHGDTEFRRDVRIIIEELNGFKFRDADSRLDELLRSHPDSFYPSFLEAYKYYWRFLLAPYDEDSSKKLERAVERTIAICNRVENLESSEARLIKGCSYVFRSALLYEEGKLFASLKWLNRGIQEVRQLEDDPVFRGDAAFILGSYQLYRVIRNTDEALEKLEIARREGYYFTTLARLLSGRIYQRGEGDPEKSLPIYQKLANEYPENSLFSFYLGKNLQMLGKYEESIEVFNRALKTITFQPPPLEMLCQIHFSLGQIFEKEMINLQDAAREYRAAYETADRVAEETRWFIPWSALHLGGVYTKMNKREKAIQWLNKVEKVDDRRAWEKAARIIKDLSP